MFINEVANNAELSAIIVNELRDLYGIKFRKEKKLKNHQKFSHRKIFGVPLNDLEFTEVKLSNGALCRIPIFVSDACARIMDQIEVEGIFRKAGSQLRQKEIREKLELGIPLDDSCNVIDIASILKYFFRELPEPLLPPGNFQETILRCLLCKGTNERKIAAIQMVCLLLPNTVLNTLVYFMQFLNLVSLHSTANKMSTKNLAIIFAPGLMPVNENYGQRLNSHVQIIEILIDNAHEIGIIPSELLNRIPGHIDVPKKHVDDHLNYTLTASAFGSLRSMDASHLKVPDTDIKKKKKRRSGSLTRMFNGFRKIVSAIGSSTENLDDSHDESEVPSTPCINKSKKRKVLETSAFSSKKKKDVLALLPSGGLLPSTPMECTKNKPAKKSRLSLGGKRYSKNGSQQTTQNQSNKSSIKQSLERRWSFMVASSVNRDNQKPHLSTIQDTISSVDQKSKEKDEVWDTQMTKSEYEEIKDRVAAIETRISKEFTKLQSSLANNSIDSVDTNDTRNGPERVLEKFERTMEETEMMNTSPLTEQLAKQLSRDLKIRSSTENRVFRSPSARKIGSIRRKSQENVRLSRNKSWHLGPNVASPVITHNTRSTKRSPLQSTVTLNSPNVEKHIQIPRANLKRGRPNTFQNGLRSTQQPTHTTVEPKLNSCSVTNGELANEFKDQDFMVDLKNEQWVCADAFFAAACKTPIKTPSKNEDASKMSASKTAAKVSVTKVKPVRKRLNMSIEVTPTKNNPPSQVNTPQVESKVSANDTMKTPMLPPRLPIVKKTPAIKTPHAVVSNRSVFTPLWQEEQHEVAGRASIARLRNQNAGMVMAKAKLFDGLVIDQPQVKKTVQATKSNLSVNKAPDGTPNDQKNPENKSDFTKNMMRYRLNQATSNSGTNSPRRANKVPLNGVNRRQHLRAQRHTPIKKTPINFDKSLVLMAGNSGGRISRNSASPAIQSPITRRMASIDATPNAKSMNLIMKPPRRIITSQNKQKI